MNNKKIDINNKNYRKNDPLGSYTGICENKYETPIQDADDL